MDFAVYKLFLYIDDRQTDGLTDRLTLVLVKSLLRLKNNDQLKYIYYIPKLFRVFLHFSRINSKESQIVSSEKPTNNPSDPPISDMKDI